VCVSLPVFILPHSLSLPLVLLIVQFWTEMNDGQHKHTHDTTRHTQSLLAASISYRNFSLSLSFFLLLLLLSHHLSHARQKNPGTLIEAAKSGSVSRFIGRSRSEDSVCNSPPPNFNRNESASNSPNSDEAVTESPTDSNPSLDKPDEHHHQQQHKHHSDPTSTNNSKNDSNSNVHNSSHSHKKDHHHHLHMPHVNLNFSALAALKRKRKKFSNSRNESPVLDPPPEHSSPSSSSLKKSIKKVIE
jgi:hypothetical protein